MDNQSSTLLLVSSRHPTNILDPVTETINNRTEPGTDLGHWRVAATSRHLGSGGCAVGVSAGTGPRLLRGWGWGEGGVGVGPLILDSPSRTFFLRLWVRVAT